MPLIVALARALPSRLRFWRARLLYATAAFRRFQPIAGAADPPPPPAPPTPPAPEPGRTFSQDELDRIVQDRLARDRAARDAKFADYDDLKTKAAKADELEAAGQSELQRAQATATKAEEDKTAAEQRATEATERANKTLIRASVIAAAAKAGAVDPDDVYALLESKNFAVPKDGKELKVTLGDDGQVTGHEEAVTAFLEGKTHLVGQTPRPGPGDGGARTTPPGTLTKDALKAMTPQQVAALKPEDVSAALAG